MTNENVIEVLDHGFVRLDACMADDLSVVNAARVSFAKVKTPQVGESDVITVGRLDEADEGLINYLMKSGHGSPFEHNAFRFHIKAPIFIAREWMRHRIGSFNEWSARYSTLEPEFYIPEPGNVRTRVGKPGHYTYEQAHPNLTEYLISSLDESCDYVYNRYNNALAEGIAPEQARFFLPVNIYTQFFWTVNARSMMNFLNLRNAPTAMWEIQQYAQIIEHFFASHMPMTAVAFEANGRVAP